MKSAPKSKTSISLSRDLLKQIDKLPGNPPRSAVVEEALVFYFRSRRAVARERADLELLNTNSQALNEEAEDVLAFQEPI